MPYNDSVSHVTLRRQFLLDVEDVRRVLRTRMEHYQIRNCSRNVKHMEVKRVLREMIQHY